MGSGMPRRKEVGWSMVRFAFCTNYSDDSAEFREQRDHLEKFSGLVINDEGQT